MITTANHFAWYEFLTTDVDAATRFYTGVGAQDSGVPGVTYTLLTAGGRPAVGLMDMPTEMRAAGLKPRWMGHVGVTDLESAAAALVKAGGVIHKPPTDIPTIGRFAAVADPQGAGFLLFQPDQSGPQNGAQNGADAAAPATPGHVGWHELQCGDLEPAFAFYAGQFGWTKADRIDMGDFGPYQTFAADGVQIGGMMKKPSAVPLPFWQFYFNIDDIDAAAARVRSAGGTINHGPTQVPNGSWVINAQDPEGASFALLGPRA